MTRYWLGAAVLALAAGSLALVSPVPTGAQSDGVVEVPADWALIPSGLGAGEEFRLLFRTSTEIAATAGGIHNWNDRAATRAAAGHAAIQEHSALFKIVGSTGDTDARDNIGMNPNNSAHRDVPIYWLAGPRVAANTAGFWSQSWENWSGTDCRMETGAVCTNPTNWPWTGTNTDGTKATHRLGSNPSVRYGSLATNSNTSSPISKNQATWTQSRPFYVMSPVFRVAAATATTAKTLPSFAPVVTHSDGSTRVNEGGAADSFTYTLADAFEGCRKIEFLAGSGLLIRQLHAPPEFVERFQFTLCPVHRNAPFEFEVRAVDDGWDVPGIWRQPGNTGDTYTSEVRIYEVGAGPDLPLVESVTVPVTIVDNDPPMVNLSGGAAVTEGGAASFTITATSPPSSALTVRYRVRQGEPFVIHKGDVVADAELGAKSVLLPAGALSATFTVPTVGDSVDEADGMVRVTLESGSGYKLVAPVYQEVAVVDDDPAVLTLVDPGFVFEGRNAVFKVRSTSPGKDAMVVNYVASETGNFFSDGVLGSQSVRFPDGSRTGVISIPTVDDSLWDPEGQLTVALRPGTGYVLGEPSEATIGTFDLASDYGSDADPVTKNSDLGNPGGGDTEDVELQDEPGTPEDDGESEVPEVPEPDGGEDPSPVVLDGDAPAAECGSADALAAEARANHDALANTASNRKERNDWWRAWIALSGKTGTYNTPLTAAEARLLESGDARWAPFRKALECAEGDPQPTPDGGEDPSPVVLDGDAPAAECGSADALAVQARANHDALRNTWWNRRERNDWWRAWIALSGKTGTHNAPLTAAEARLLETGDARWVPFRKALECVEGAPAQP